MSATKVRSSDMKVEIVVIPVSDVDREKNSTGGSGGGSTPSSPAVTTYGDPVTPPGSGCSVIFGKNVTAAAPGSAQSLYLIVSDIVAARDESAVAASR